MSATLTREQTSITVQPYTIANLGRTYCGACVPPVPGAHVQHIDQRRRVWDVPDGRDLTDAEWRESTAIFVAHCDRCGAHPADFPRFELTGIATVEHVQCHIF